jgi:hypothetical protein
LPEEAFLLVRLLRCPLLHDRLLAGFISVPYPHNARRLDWFQRCRRHLEKSLFAPVTNVTVWGEG